MAASIGEAQAKTAVNACLYHADAEEIVYWQNDRQSFRLKTAGRRD